MVLVAVAKRAPPPPGPRNYCAPKTPTKILLWCAALVPIMLVTGTRDLKHMCFMHASRVLE